MTKNSLANNYSRFHSWMSGGNNNSARAFFQANGLTDFYWGMGGPGQQGTFGIYGMGGSTQGRPSRANYPAECFLPVQTVRYGGERVIDYSNPLAVRLRTRSGRHNLEPPHRAPPRVGPKWTLRTGGTNGRGSLIPT